MKVELENLSRNKKLSTVCALAVAIFSHGNEDCVVGKDGAEVKVRADIWFLKFTNVWNIMIEYHKNIDICYTLWGTNEDF